MAANDFEIKMVSKSVLVEKEKITLADDGKYYHTKAVYDNIKSIDAEELNVIKSINNSILNTINTPVGSLIYDPEIGGSISGILHEQMSPLTIMDLKIRIKSELFNYENRIKVSKIDVKENKQRDGYDVSIYYTVNGTNLSGNVSTAIGIIG